MRIWCRRFPSFWKHAVFHVGSGPVWWPLGGYLLVHVDWGRTSPVRWCVFPMAFRRVFAPGSLVFFLFVHAAAPPNSFVLSLGSRAFCDGLPNFRRLCRFVRVPCVSSNFKWILAVPGGVVRVRSRNASRRCSSKVLHFVSRASRIFQWSSKS